MDKDGTAACQPPEGPILCSNNCGFFGSATTMNLCSKCYRDVVMKQAKASEAAAVTCTTQLPLELPLQDSSTHDDAASSSSVQENQPAPPVQANRCFTCKRHVGLTGFKCKCGNQFCSLHRYHDRHNCPFDYRAAARDAIARANPVIKADKVDKI
ncbi:hypothetical protein KP509_31G021300 [Ceratopteris richardii]|nr:hypothetical protein KP509_31G021300 [Ceratopteris richardii]